ncbi:hypothetical protein [Paraburkholderia dinghuensis]|uniref:Uncharacterized protein n=1 Tax=Paraburkholderia dinghuensis TaxID=2305225 RepID=A0A3N6P7E8_9BURK|nr:hypothetical protein [Paraburkholderia dinghuensis]RQH09983.1 hypothetical protein D1Y85_02270 [Paraburkholderia dinghuensis]
MTAAVMPGQANESELLVVLTKMPGTTVEAANAPSEKAGNMPDATLAALDLADHTEFAPVTKKRLIVLVEAASVLNESASNVQRGSLDLRWDTPLMGRLADNWHLVFSDRFDGRVYSGLSESRGVNTLREAYVTYQPGYGMSIDVGRVNTRYGVAFGYNPTDFLGRGTVRSVISADPESLRNNRLGNAMVRLQQTSDKSAITLIASPKLGDHPDDSGGSLDWGASNPRNRVLLAGSYRFADNLNPQWLLFLEEGRSLQLGFNFSRVLSRSTLLYTEWAGGRQPLDWQTSLPASQQDIAWRNRVATGVTWTSEKGLTLRLEGQYDGSADNERALSVLAAAPAYAMSLGNGSAGSSAQQALDWVAPRRSVLVQGYWTNVFDQYDLNLIWQRDLQRQRNMGFAELRRHIGPVDLALQWQRIYRLGLDRQIHADQRWQVSCGYYF